MAKQTYEALFLLSGQLTASFGSAFRSAGKAFEGLKTGAAGFSTAVTGAMGKVGSALTSIPAQIAGLGAGAGFVAMGAHAISLASDMEKLGTAMTVHLGSASKAQALIGEIQKFAVETPFEFPELATAGKQMLAFGFAGDQVVTNLRMLGDVASGLSMPIGDLVYLFGTMKAQGRVFQNDINQLTNRGIPIYDALTKSMKETAKAQGELTIKVGEGKKAMDVPLEQFSEKHLRAMTEAGQIGFDQITKAFQQLTGEGGKFFGMIEAQSQTFGGRLSTMKDNVNNLFLQIGQPIVDTISPFLAEINASPVWANMAAGIKEQLTPAIQGLVVALKGDLGGAITTLGGDFMNFIGSVGTELAKVFGGLSKTKGPTLPQPGVFAGLSAASGGVVGQAAKATEAQPDMTWIKTAEGMIKSLSTAFQWLAENMDKVVLAVQVLAGAFAAAQLVGLIAAIANPIGLVVIAVAALTAGLAYLVTNWDSVTAAMNNAWAAVQQWAQAEWTTFTDNLGAIGAKAQETWNTLKNVPVLGTLFQVMEQSFMTTVEAIKMAWNGLVAFFQGAAPQIAAGLAGVGQALLTAFMGPINQIKAAWDALVNAIKSFNPGQWLGNIGRAITGQKAAVPAEVPKMAAGGFVNRPMLAQIGEAGPEAVIPLSGDRSRAQGLLASAADRLGMSGGGGGTILNFTPNVTINGAPNPELITTLDKKLHELSRDFLSEYKKAHGEQRRLAFG